MASDINFDRTLLIYLWRYYCHIKQRRSIRKQYVVVSLINSSTLGPLFETEIKIGV